MGVNLAPDTPFRATMLAGAPFIFAFNLNTPSPVRLNHETFRPNINQQVQRAYRSALGKVDLQGLQEATECDKVRHCPVHADQPERDLDNAGRLRERDAKQHLDCQAEHVALPKSG